MRKITVQDLIYIVPDLINLFLSGFIFVWFYNWLNGKEMNISLLTVWSLFISFLIKNIYSVAHGFILKDIEVNDSAKILIYAATGITLACICNYLKNTRWVQRLLNHANNKSVNDDIFDDIIDYKNSTWLYIYIKASNICYAGNFSRREEKGMDSWIVLVHYYIIDKETLLKIGTQDTAEMRTSVAINLSNVERIELFYDKESEVWKRLKR